MENFTDVVAIIGFVDEVSGNIIKFNKNE